MLNLVLFLGGCFATQHVVGEGGTYGGNDMKMYDIKQKHWYLLWGAVPLDDVNANSVAGGAQNYTVRETFTFGDLALRAVTLGIASPRTIRVSKSAEEK